MKYLTPFLMLFVITFTSQADMGFFGSIAQNPAPSDTFQVHPFIELTCEDVVIEVYPGGEAEITADFLFTNTGQADTVIPRGDLGIKHFISWSSTSMPEAICEANYSFSPLPAIVNAPGFELTHLFDIQDLEIEDAIVWLFHDFEPVVSRGGWMYYFESSTDQDAIYHAEMYEDGSANWPSSLRVIVKNGGLKYL